jgi:EAL domain-containing protein (putative c-di-GMP-specific phosphodiesterase class I)/ActR/RegA family two-component response regulator
MSTTELASARWAAEEALATYAVAPEGAEGPTVAHNRVLLVDDDEAVLRAYLAALTKRGWDVRTARGGEEAIAHLREGPFAAIVSDVAMPEMSGVEFLKAVREQDLDVPVILMTGAPELESAMRAYEYGAFRYLKKPVPVHLLDETLRVAVRLHDLARLKRRALELVGIERGRIGDRAGLEARFALALDLVYVAFQPIVSLRSQDVVGFEALLRSYEPTLRNPGEILAAAEQLGRVHELGRVVRARVAFDAIGAPPRSKIFINLHPLDLNDDDLYSPSSALAQIASRVVLEVTERASLDGVRDVLADVKNLRTQGFQIAVDDLGAGYSGLTNYSRLEPEVAKIDMSLIRDIDSDPRKRSIVSAIAKLCDELGTLVVAEGVETPSERDALAAMGVDLLQGYLFARPARGFPRPCW